MIFDIKDINGYLTFYFGAGGLTNAPFQSLERSGTDNTRQSTLPAAAHSDMIRRMPKNSSLQEYARLGAAARLSEIEAEMTAIRKAFPDLGAPRVQKGRAGRSSNQAPPAGKRRRKLSAAARKAISDAQKKRWAAQKAKKS